MTVEEAKEKVLLYIYMDVENIPDNVLEAFSVYQEAIEKQIPKKMNNGCFCPNCEADFGYYDDWDVCSYSYCPECGQRLDWRTEDDSKRSD